MQSPDDQCGPWYSPWFLLGNNIKAKLLQRGLGLASSRIATPKLMPSRNKYFWKLHGLLYNLIETGEQGEVCIIEKKYIPFGKNRKKVTLSTSNLPFLLLGSNICKKTVFQILSGIWKILWKPCSHYLSFYFLYPLKLKSQTFYLLVPLTYQLRPPKG